MRGIKTQVTILAVILFALSGMALFSHTTLAREKDEPKREQRNTDFSQFISTLTSTDSTNTTTPEQPSKPQATDTETVQTPSLNMPEAPEPQPVSPEPNTAPVTPPTPQATTPKKTALNFTLPKKEDLPASAAQQIVSTPPSQQVFNAPQTFAQAYYYPSQGFNHHTTVLLNTAGALIALTGLLLLLGFPFSTEPRPRLVVAQVQN